MNFGKYVRKWLEVLQEIAVKVGVQSRRHRGHRCSELSEGLFRTDVFGGRQLLTNTMKRPHTQHLPESFALTVELRKFGKQTFFVNVQAHWIVIVFEQLVQVRVFLEPYPWNEWRTLTVTQLHELRLGPSEKRRSSSTDCALIQHAYKESFPNLHLMHGRRLARSSFKDCVKQTRQPREWLHDVFFNCTAMATPVTRGKHIFGARNWVDLNFSVSVLPQSKRIEVEGTFDLLKKVKNNDKYVHVQIYTNMIKYDQICMNRQNMTKGSERLCTINVVN